MDKGDSDRKTTYSTADRQLHLIAPDRAFSVIKSMAHLHDSPILACIPYGKQTSITITSGMSGQTVLYDHEKNKVLDERRDHTKYVVKASTYEEDGGVVVSSSSLFTSFLCKVKAISTITRNTQVIAKQRRFQHLLVCQGGTLIVRVASGLPLQDGMLKSSSTAQ